MVNFLTPSPKVILSHLKLTKLQTLEIMKLQSFEVCILLECATTVMLKSVEKF